MLNLGSLGAFPAVTRPRVLYLGLEGQTDRLCRLQQQITTDLQELGFEKEERAFTAHLTLGTDQAGRSQNGSRDSLSEVRQTARRRFHRDGSQTLPERTPSGGAGVYGHEKF